MTLYKKNPFYPIFDHFQQYFKEMSGTLGTNRISNNEILTLLAEFHQAHHITSLADTLWT
jgi:hypothetical protein